MEADLSPTAKLHDEWGARWDVSFKGERVVRDYGNPSAERRMLASGCALFERSGIDLLVFSGADRQRFLHGLVTCDIKTLEPGQGTYGFFTDGKGRLLADLVAVADGEEMRVAVPPGMASLMSEHLGRYIIADRVEIESSEDSLAVSLLGPEAGSFLEGRLGGRLPDKPWSHAALSIEGSPVTVVRNGRAWCGGFTVWIPLERAEDTLRSLLEHGGSVVPVGWGALDALRLELGVPRFGPDFGPGCFPQETGLEDEAVSYEKGCYLGQEIVARIHYRGQANRVMTRVRIDAGETPPVGTILSDAGREAGRLGTVVAANGDDCRAFALIQRRASEPGTALLLPDGRTATVIDTLSR